MIVRIARQIAAEQSQSRFYNRVRRFRRHIHPFLGRLLPRRFRHRIHLVSTAMPYTLYALHPSKFCIIGAGTMAYGCTINPKSAFSLLYHKNARLSTEHAYFFPIYALRFAKTNHLWWLRHAPSVCVRRTTLVTLPKIPIRSPCGFGFFPLALVRTLWYNYTAICNFIRK